MRWCAYVDRCVVEHGRDIHANVVHVVSYVESCMGWSMCGSAHVHVCRPA